MAPSRLKTFQSTGEPFNRHRPAARSQGIVDLDDGGFGRQIMTFRLIWPLQRKNRSEDHGFPDGSGVGSQYMSLFAPAARAPERPRRSQGAADAFYDTSRPRIVQVDGSPQQNIRLQHFSGPRFNKPDGRNSFRPQKGPKTAAACGFVENYAEKVRQPAGLLQNRDPEMLQAMALLSNPLAVAEGAKVRGPRHAESHIKHAESHVFCAKSCIKRRGLHFSGSARKKAGGLHDAESDPAAESCGNVDATARNRRVCIIVSYKPL